MPKHSRNALKKKGASRTVIAMSILRGAGIKVDEKKKIQHWIVGRTVSKKVALAGAVLDAIKDEAGEPVWKTHWDNPGEAAAIPQKKAGKKIARPAPSAFNPMRICA